jgi:hypothetical protein
VCCLQVIRVEAHGVTESVRVTVMMLESNGYGVTE